MRRFNKLAARIFLIMLVLSSVCILPSASSDFYESTYNNGNYICRSTLTTDYGRSKIEYEDSAILVTSELTISCRPVNGSQCVQLPTCRSIAYSYAEVIGNADIDVVFCSAIHNYLICSNPVYFVGLTPWNKKTWEK